MLCLKWQRNSKKLKENIYEKNYCNAFSGGLGFFLAMVLFAGIRQKLETCDIPKCLQGLPITLVAASLLAVSFLGFQGIVDGLIA